MGEFLLGVVVISLSGVMAPGPMTAVTAGRGVADPHAGALVAVGHGIVELPLIVLYFFGLGVFDAAAGAAGRAILGAAGGVVLLVMAAGMIAGRGTVTARASTRRGGAVADGAVLTAANPYFHLWWLTAGSVLITRSAAFGTAGLAAFMTVHWLCDLSWCWTLSSLSHRGTRFFGPSFQRRLFVFMGILLLFFGARFFYDAVVLARTLLA